jgi:hypothetical protein
MKSLTRCYCEFEVSHPMTEASLQICHRRQLYKLEWPITLSSNRSLSLLQRMASNDNNNKHKLEEEAESSVVRKRLWLSDDDSGDDDFSDSSEEEEVSFEESPMNQLDTYEKKLLAKRSRDLLFSNDGDTTSPSSEPRTPKMSSSHVHSDPNGSDDDNNF